MKRVEGVLSSTAIDAHGEMMSREALEVMVQTLKQNYIPIGIEHDPRHGPVGRFIEAWIDDLENGVSVLKGVGEIFEPGDTLPEHIDKTIVERGPYEHLVIGYDRSYENPEDIAEIEAIAARFGSRPEFEAKKALDPLSILRIGGAFALGSIATGFFGQIGADAYLWSKKHLVALIERQKSKSKEQLLVFEFSIALNGHKVLVQTILSNPAEPDIETFLKEAIYELDHIPSNFLNPIAHLSRLVYFYENGHLEFKYAVRTDGFPVVYKVATDGKDA